ncbi:MAG: DUF58 domain-containing protein [Phycisphaerales bacterium]|jgi:uncharacterized protein (DUF58 family)|nr:DUF58 domain-containing protein [Phycisphaerales bacterium]
MSESVADYRTYLDPRVLARVSSLDIRARLIVEGLMTGQHRSPYQGISVEFAQHRPYVAGDDIRHVDWKVFGKTDKIYLKQYQEETNLHLLCIVDASQSMAFGSVAPAGEALSPMEKVANLLGPNEAKPWSKYDHATAITAVLSYMAIQQQDSVGLAIFDNDLKRYFKPSNAPAQWKIITHELQQTPRLKKTNTGRVLDQLAEKLTQRSLIVLLSDFFDDIESIKKGLRHLRYKKHELMVFQILDPLEIEFPFEDVILFKGLEEMGELLTEPRALRQGYLEQLSRFTDELKRLCRGMDIDFVRMNSGEPLDVALSGFLATRAAGVK